MYVNRLKQFRQKNNVTQKQMAEAIGIAERQYWRYEAGQNELPIRYLVAICKAYKIDANWLLGLEEHTHP